MVSEAEGVRGQCDPTTVYRTLMMFKEAKLVRLAGTLRKASYFVLSVPGDPAHFLIRTRCGRITELPLPGAVAAEIERLAAAQGFASTPPECEIFGLCASCQEASQSHVAPSKLMIRVAGRVVPSE